MGRGLSHRLLEGDIPSRMAVAMRCPPLAADSSNAVAVPESGSAALDTVGIDSGVVVADPDTERPLADSSVDRAVDGREFGAGGIAHAQLKMEADLLARTRHGRSP